MYIKRIRIIICIFQLQIIFFTLISCSTIPPAELLSFRSINDIQPQWEKIDKGICYFHGKVSTPKIEFYALQIDLSLPNIEVFVKSEAGTVSEFTRDKGLIAGINANPYDENHKNIGLVISDTVTLSPPNSNYDAIVFYRDNESLRAVITKQSSIYSTENIENAIGGFYQILADGELTQRTLHNAAARRHPRSAAGVSPKGTVLYLLVIDGRRAGSIGTTEAETALLLRSLGCYSGLNLDGGGSSVLAIRDKDGKVKIVNTPGGHGVERKIGACLGIISNEQ